MRPLQIESTLAVLGDAGRSAMKKHTLVIALALSLVPATLLADEEQPTLQQLIDRFHKLQSEQCSDNSRDEPLLFADLEVASLSQDEKQAAVRIALNAIEHWEKLAKRRHPGVTAEQRNEALKRIERKDFNIDSRIAKRDVDEIVKYIVAHPPLDPRILSFRYEDKGTVRITTGVVRGPLNGGGSMYVARRENGRWVVRSNGGWVS